MRTLDKNGLNLSFASKFPKATLCKRPNHARPSNIKPLHTPAPGFLGLDPHQITITRLLACIVAFTNVLVLPRHVRRQNATPMAYPIAVYHGQTTDFSLEGPDSTDFTLPAQLARDGGRPAVSFHHGLCLQHILCFASQSTSGSRGQPWATLGRPACTFFHLLSLDVSMSFFPDSAGLMWWVSCCI